MFVNGQMAGQYKHTMPRPPTLMEALQKQ